MKTELRKEEYLQLPIQHRAPIAELRCGTSRLRVETGRWSKEALEERFCKVCICGPIEDEKHVLLDCFIYDDIREKLFHDIKLATNYDLNVMAEDNYALLSILIGCGIGNREQRTRIYQLVGNSLLAIFRRRAKILKL